jgi:hypothetical protein
MRQALRQTRAPRAQVARGASIPCPVGGWDAVSALEDMPPDRAVVLDNWFPTTSDVRIRRGFISHATGMGSSPVESIMVYQGTTDADSRMFAAAGGDIYDATSSGAASSVVSSVTNNRFQWVNFTTSAGKFLWICNGDDAPQHYNGSVWATPALNVTTFTGTDIINVSAHKNRLWFVFRDSTVAGYLPTGAIAGTVTNFELGGLFTKGGYLVATATWTKDGGAGEDDLFAAMSSEGQVAVYAGTDPSSANTWALVGVFDLGPPIGRRCFTKVAGDLALINIDGVLPLSRALGQDRGSAAAIAITKNINNAMNEAARSYKGVFGWELTPYPKGTMAILNVPIAAASLQHQYVMNTLTGAWCRFTGMNANTWAVFDDDLYFGGNAGVVYQADVGGIDGDLQIDADGQGAYNYYKSRGQLKQWNMMQPILTTDTDGRPAVGISTDFKDNAELGTPTVSTLASAMYDEAIWDTDVYAIEGRTVSDWTTISGIGMCASIHFRSTTSTAGETVVRLNGFNVLYEQGGIL